jgi:hypothetical protein
VIRDLRERRDIQVGAPHFMRGKRCFSIAGRGAGKKYVRFSAGKPAQR